MVHQNINFSVVLYVKKSILHNALINRQGLRVKSLSFGFPLTLLLAFLYVLFYCVFVTFLCGFLGQVWYFIVSIPDLCILPYFVQHFSTYAIIVGAFNKKMRFIFNTIVSNGNTCKLFVQLGLKGKFTNVMSLI